MDVAFKIYNDGLQLVAVVFPKQGGGPLLRKTWPLNLIGLKPAENIPQILDIANGNYKIKNDKALERGGLDIHIDYEKERIIVYPKTKLGTKLDAMKIVYKFSHIGVSPDIKTYTEKSMDLRKLSARKRKKPLSNKEYKGDDK